MLASKLTEATHQASDLTGLLLQAEMNGSGFSWSSPELAC